jgi:hypothetical protein
MRRRALIAGFISAVYFAATSGVLAQSNPEPTPDQDPTGQTIGKAKVDTAGSNVNIDLRVDWLVDSKYRDTNVVTRELEPVQGFRDLSKGIDASLLSSRLSTSYLSGLPASVRNFSFRQQLQYDWPPNSGKPHDLKAHPEMPVVLPEDETTH